MRISFALLLFAVNILNTTAQNNCIKAGPMLGYNTMKEVGIWCQFNQNTNAQIIYWPKDSIHLLRSSAMQLSEKAKQGIVKFNLEDLEPGTTYQYTVLCDGSRAFDSLTIGSFTTQSLWKWRRNPDDFSFLAGSCLYVNESKYDRPGIPYGSSPKILETMAKDTARFMIWLGDNVYLRESDWESRSGIFRRYSHTRSIPEMQSFLRNMHHYAIWDDHDFGPNDSNSAFELKDFTLEAFNSYWMNPYNSGTTEQQGNYTKFTWQDCEFFLLDARFFKNLQKGEFLGKTQMTWLKANLQKSSAMFKFIAVGSQFLNPGAEKESFEKEAPSERTEILQFLEKNEIKGTVFLTGDRHFTELSYLNLKDKNAILEITSSPITSGLENPKSKDEPNILRIADSYFLDHNYCKVSISGPLKDRKLKVDIVDKLGHIRWSRMFNKNEFGYK